jgi:hypothetical protein
MAFACRDMDCGMSFSNDGHRKKHENIMHKNMYKDAAKKLIEKINNTHDETALNKKVIKVLDEKFSYKEVMNFINENNQKELDKILPAIEQTIKLYLDRYPDSKIRDFLTIAEVKIN